VLALMAEGHDNTTISRRLVVTENAVHKHIGNIFTKLGFTPGDDRTVADWSQIRDYFARLDAASPRVLVQQIGTTTLGRPLIVAFVSEAENIRDLPKYQNIQRRLADPRLDAGDRDVDWGASLSQSGKTVVAVSCSIHSTEIVASQMSMQLAYELARAGDEETLEILRETIMLLIPSANPDGVDIVADWYRKSLGKPWEGTDPPELYHHYAGHDNNRDWFMLNLEETRAVTRLFWREWFPQIVYDVHQQGPTGSRFFVPPFYDPANPYIPPLLLREVGLLGHRIAADAQAAGFSGVITNALYDTWWHGGFRTAPYYHNSVGILSEAASARLMTPVRVTREQLARASTRGMPSALKSATNFPDPWPGGLWRPRDIMRLEMLAVRSVLSMAAKHRERYLRNFYDLGRRALDWPPKGGETDAERTLAFLIPAGQGRDEAVAKLVGALVEQGVEVHRLERELHAQLDRDIHAAYQHGAPHGNSPDRPQDVPLGSYLVFLVQPSRANVQALFERQDYPERRGPDGAAEQPYDVAGWTLPMQMGVETARVFRVVEPERARRLRLVGDENEVRRDLGLAPKEERPAGVAARPPSPVPNPLPRPVRLALYQSWTASMDEGWTRYLFDTFNVPYASLRDAEVRAGNLRGKYDVIVLPSLRLKEIVEGRAKETAPAEFVGGVGERGVEHLRRFVEEGGTLVCWDDSAEFAIKSFKLPLRNVLEGLKTSEFYCPGSILRVEVETTDPLARGLPRLVDAYFVNSAAFEATDPRRVRVVARYAAGGVLRSGWLLGEEHLRGRVALAEVALGRGRVVLFGFRPQHRGQTWGTFP
ncbi:MAG: LuxR C-terminal-related transcriptional regulator, partial [Acidobacteriota bacterium]|nr:LuxR C-terminal-related transcriptional regulator [Acidobacteriota bacterium]